MSEIVLNTRPTTQLPQLLRLVGGAVIALIVTFLLYWLMASLVAAGREAMTEGPSGRIVDFVRVKKDQDLNVDQKKPEKPQKPQKAAKKPRKATNPLFLLGNRGVCGFSRLFGGFSRLLRLFEMYSGQCNTL